LTLPTVVGADFSPAIGASNTLTYFRMKNGEQAQMSIGTTLADLLKQLPTTGPLFPKIAATTGNARSSEFPVDAACGFLFFL